MILASETPVPVAYDAFSLMYRFARLMWRLKQNPAYQEALRDELPPAAEITPETPSVLMGFDFHLTPDGPKLIEINNNAGGLYVGDGRWLPQPELPQWRQPLEIRLRRMFPAAWRRIAIMDENVTQQFMYPEMLAYAELLRAEGRQVWVVCPEEIVLRSDGLYVGETRLDAIYNRHTDFYLEGPELAHIRRAYEAGWVQLNPHPRSYALLGDKRRLVSWWRPGFLDALLSDSQVTFIRGIVPESRLMSEVDVADLWRQRKQWVFKPAARHGGKGVLLGRSITRRRFEMLDPKQTIVQRYVPPQRLVLNGQEFKFDVRLYTCADRLVALAGRVWKGQVTNFRSPGSGWTPIAVPRA